MSINFLNNGDPGFTARNIINQLVSSSNVNNLSYGQLQTAINNGTLIEGALYKIEAADPNLYGGTDIILQAISSASLGTKGVGKFYNPNYNKNVEGYGIWRPYTTFDVDSLSGPFEAGTPYGESVSYLGLSGNIFGTVFSGSYNIMYSDSDWTGVTELTGSSSDNTALISKVNSPLYAIGDKVIWGGKVWENLSGDLGIAVDSYVLANGWIEIPFNDTDYIAVWDEIEYDFENNFIISRKEVTSNNKVEQTYQNYIDFNNRPPYNSIRAILGFQWGNPFDASYNSGLEGNNIIDSYIELINFKGTSCYQNEFSQYSYMANNNFDLNSEFNNNKVIDSYINDNFFGGNLIVFESNFIVGSNISNNTLVGNSRIKDNNITNTGINQNVLVNGGINKNFGTSANLNYNNILESSQITENSLLSSDISENTLISSSLITFNSLTENSLLSNNILNIDCEISKNSISNASQIILNNITGVINGNIIANSSSIYNNNIDTLNNNSFLNSYHIQDIYNSLYQVGISNINVNSIGNSAINGLAINLGSSNNIRSSLGVSFGSYNYQGGQEYEAYFESSSLDLYILGDITGDISQYSFIYITTSDTNETVTRQVIDVSYDGAYTTASIDNLINDSSTTASISNTNYGYNTLTLGSTNTLTSNNSLAVGSANETTALGNNSLLVGLGNVSNKSETLVSGLGGVARYNTSRVLSGQVLGGNPTTLGNCQTVEMVIGCTTTNQIATDLLLDGNKKLIIPISGSNLAAYKFEIEIIAMQIDGINGNLGDTFSQTITGVIVDRLSTVQFLGSPDFSTPIVDPSLTVSVSVTADDTNKCLKVTAAGEFNKTINWVGKVTLIQTF